MSKLSYLWHSSLPTRDAQLVPIILSLSKDACEYELAMARFDRLSVMVWCVRTRVVCND